MDTLRRILVVDDDPLVRAACTRFLSRQEGLEVCGEARDGVEAVAAFERWEPDVVLMDLDMPVRSGTEATREIVSRWPAACVVVLTTFASQEHVVGALRAGAAGYLVKDVGGAGLLLGIRQALAGDMPLSTAVRRELVAELVEQQRDDDATSPGPARLTPRELEAVGWLAQGLTNQQIAARMFLSEGSVKQHLTRIGTKLGTSSRTGILITAIQQRLIDPYAVPSPSPSAGAGPAGGPEHP